MEVVFSISQRVMVLHQGRLIAGGTPEEVHGNPEVQKVYRSQGQNIHDKHFEVVIRKMVSKVTLQVFRNDVVIFERGSPSDCFYVIVSGRCSVQHSGY